MTYDPIDTSASDDTADSSATIDEIDATVLQGLNLDTVDAGRPVRIGEENGQAVFTASIGGVAPSATVLAHYPLNEGSGTTAVDVTGNEPTMVLDDGDSGANFVSDPNGIGGFSVDCNGSTDHLDLLTLPSFFDSQTGTITVLYTIDLDSTAAGQAFMNTADSVTIHMGIGRNGGQLGAVHEGDRENTGNIPSSPFRFGGEFSTTGVVDLFVDGQSAGVGDSDNSPFQQGGPAVTFMKSYTDRRFTDGRIDNIVFYDGSLTSSQLQADFDAQPYSP